MNYNKDIVKKTKDEVFYGYGEIENNRDHE